MQYRAAYCAESCSVLTNGIYMHDYIALSACSAVTVLYCNVLLPVLPGIASVDNHKFERGITILECTFKFSLLVL